VIDVRVDCQGFQLPLISAHVGAGPHMAFAVPDRHPRTVLLIVS